jgi:hypothetical protein
MIIDTPSFEVSNEEGETRCNEMILRLQRIKYVNSIFIVINGS